MSGSDPSIEVLLATYNGATFLADQLDSLLAQDNRQFCVVAADDGSQDCTVEVLAHYAATNPGFLRLIDSPSLRRGPSANFARLLDTATADYVMFCDQDDVWQPDKLSESLALMRAVEAQHGAGCPILVHSDLVVVDAALDPLGPSFAAYTGLDPHRNDFAALLLGNVVTGCTVLANRALYELARPVPPESPMFDHWLAQVAAGHGQIAYLDQPTVMYRQHGSNVLGARKAGGSSIMGRINRTLLSDKVLRVLSRYSAAAAVHITRFGASLTADDAKRAITLAKIWRLPRYRRFTSLAAAGLFKPSLMTNLGLFCLLLRDGRPERFAGKE